MLKTKLQSITGEAVYINMILKGSVDISRHRPKLVKQGTPTIHLSITLKIICTIG